MLEKYDRDRRLYEDLAASMRSLIGVLTPSSGVSPHSISSRVKERASIAKKIEQKDKYNSLDQITDIVGIRIITHYSDEVDRIAELIETEFNVDFDNSVDKRSILDPDRFGYISLHYVVNIKTERSKLLEYKHFSGVKFEIQIRSILQHTWAEIEHDIGYKAKIEVPKPIRRKFSRLAGLLELADDQFVQIRDDLKGYERAIRKNIRKKPENIGIDAVTIFEYANKSQKLKELDEKVAQLTSFQLRPLDKGDAGRHVKYLQYFGIESISELEQELIENEDSILRRATDIGKSNRKQKTASQGISIFYLHQVLAAKRLDKEEILPFLNKMSLSGKSEREEFANYLSNFFGSDL